MKNLIISAALIVALCLPALAQNGQGKVTITKAATFVVFLARAPDFPSLRSE